MRSCLTVLAMLASVSGGDPKNIDIKLKFIESTVAPKGAKAGALVMALSQKDTQALLEKLAVDGVSKITHEPNLVLPNDRDGNIFFGDMAPVVTGHQVDIDETGKSIVTPITVAAKFGTTLFLKAAAGEKIAFKRFELSMTQPRRKLGEMKRIQTVHGEITDPEFHTMKYTVRSSVPNGDSLLIGPLDKPWGGKDEPKLWILATAKVIEAPGK